MTAQLRIVGTPADKPPLSLDLPAETTGFIYYIGCTETLRLKIGYTAGDPYFRLRALQTGSPTILAMLAILPGTLTLERKLHARFAACRVRGEWFQISERLFEHLQYVAFQRCGLSLEHGKSADKLLLFGQRALGRV